MNLRSRFRAIGRWKGVTSCQHTSATAKPPTRRRELILWIEGVGFGLIIALGWAAEVAQVPHMIFSESAGFNWARPLMKTVIVAGVWIAVHLATRRLLARLHQLEEYLLICAWCRKIGHEGEWMTTEDFFDSALSTQATHGICPECARSMKASVERALAPAATTVAVEPAKVTCTAG